LEIKKWEKEEREEEERKVPNVTFETETSFRSTSKKDSARVSFP